MKSEDFRVDRIDVLSYREPTEEEQVLMDEEAELVKVELLKAEILESVTQDLMESNLTSDEYEEIKNKIIDIFLEY